MHTHRLQSIFISPPCGHSCDCTEELTAHISVDSLCPCIICSLPLSRPSDLQRAEGGEEKKEDETLMQQPKIAEEIGEAVAQFLIQTPPPLPRPLLKHSDLKIEA